MLHSLEINIWIVHQDPYSTYARERESIANSSFSSEERSRRDCKLVNICGAGTRRMRSVATENSVEGIRRGGVGWRSAWQLLATRPRACYKSRSGACRRCGD